MAECTGICNPDAVTLRGEATKGLLSDSGVG